jgi:hypothetical protein
VEIAVTYALLAATPAAVFLLAIKALERFTTSRPPLRRRTAVPVEPSLERLVADLRRLEGDYRRIEASDLPGRAARLRTVTLAYDDTLRACCTALDLPQPDRPPLSPLVRLQTEAALAQRGLTW